MSVSDFKDLIESQFYQPVKSGPTFGPSEEELNLVPAFKRKSNSIVNIEKVAATVSPEEAKVKEILDSQPKNSITSSIVSILITQTFYLISFTAQLITRYIDAGGI